MENEPVRLLIRRAEGWLDINAPHRTPAVAPPEPLPAGTVAEGVEREPAMLLRRDGGGGWFIHPALLWSLLDPMRPRPPSPTDDAIALARRLWARLAWWQGLPAVDRQTAGSLLDRCARGGGELVTLLDRLAAAGNPLGAAIGPSVALKAAPGHHGACGGLPEDPAQVASFCLDPAGLGALYGARFVPRTQQADMAAAVARALIAHQPLLAEAGTGTGKTLAYLVPLIGRLMAARGRAVVSTYSRALQVQILEGDFPRLTAGQADLNARLLMGRAHYLCLRQRRAYLARLPENDRQAAAAAALRLWLLATEEGLRDELAEHPLLASELRVLFSAVQPCLPDCWEQPGCYVARARRLAREAQLVVVNHALLLSDGAAAGSLIGPYHDLVVDEAHRLPQVMLEACTVRLDGHRVAELEDLVGSARAAGQAPEVPLILAGRLQGCSEGQRAGEAASAFGLALNRSLRAYRSWWSRVSEFLAPGPAAAAGQRVRIADKQEAFAPLAALTADLHDAAAAAAAAGAVLNQCSETLSRLDADVVDMLARCAQAGQLVERLLADVRFVTSDPSDRWVTWLEPGAQGALRCLGATPLEPGPHLRDFWAQEQRAPIATSATLAVGQDFGFMLGELGLSGRRPQTVTTTVPSPFDWERQTLCLAVENLPGPDHVDFPVTLASILADLRREVPRQTLVLFTSYRLLQDVAQRLKADECAVDLFTAATGTELLVQTQQTGAGELRERFRKGKGAMLLGTSTFWEGVDFPGASLEVLVVTKLPFQVPNDPWVQARCEHIKAAGDDPFRDFMLRDAVLRLRQGVGRLLRRDTDRGVVLLLDNRLIARSYGATFLSALAAPVHWLRDPVEVSCEVRRFFERS